MPSPFRTRPAAPPWLPLVVAALIAATAATLLAWPLSALGMAVGLSTLMSEDTTALGGWLASAMLAAGPLYVLAGFAPGLPLAAWAIARGGAGWGTAALAGLAVGLGLAALAGVLSGPASTATFAAMGLTAGLVFWVALRVVAPAAVAPPAA